MADHLELKGGGCFGGRDRSDNYLILMFLLPWAIVIARSPVSYWFRSRAFNNLFRRNRWREGTCTSDDPYDLSAIYQEYKLRAAIGQEMANKDANRDGFVKPVYEGAYALSESDKIVGDASAPTPIVLDAPVRAALQQAAVDPEKLRQYAEDGPFRDHRFLNTVLAEAGVADLGARLKAIRALQGAEEDADDAKTGDAPRCTVKAQADEPGSPVMGLRL